MQQPLASPTNRRGFISTGLWTLVNNRFVSPVLDLVFPPVCIGCNRVDVLLCDNCIASFQPPDTTLQDTTGIVAVGALGQYEGVIQKANQALKYDHFTDLARPLGRLLAEHVRVLGWPQGIIMPVPLHPDRLQQRGYNQSALLAIEMARQLNWRYEDTILRRKRATASQVSLDFRARQHNVEDAFCVVDPILIQNSNVILVDDVYTTGATIRECAITVMKAGAAIVHASVVGRTNFTEKDC